MPVLVLVVISVGIVKYGDAGLGRERFRVGRRFKPH
jgi:hypothetical protein